MKKWETNFIQVIYTTQRERESIGRRTIICISNHLIADKSWEKSKLQSQLPESQDVYKWIQAPILCVYVCTNVNVCRASKQLIYQHYNY